jgi:beta-galactosidase
MKQQPDRLVDRRTVLKGTAGAATAFLIAPRLGLADESKAFQFGRRQPFDLDWRFRRGEGHELQAPGVSDSDWRSIDLPHDWSIEDLPPPPAESKAHILGPFDSSAAGGTATGFALGGEGWYRKRFTLELPAKGHAEILFDGIYMNTDVWLNGHHLGAHASGYAPLAYDLTPHLTKSGENILAVRVQNLGQNSRWYSGSGINRHVWLDVLPNRARIARWGVAVTVQKIDTNSAAIAVRTQLEDAISGLSVVSRVRDERGAIVAEQSIAAAAAVEQTMAIVAPKLWSPGNPALYTLESELRHDSAVVDHVSTPFGVRIVTFDTEHGMSINGAPTKLRGGCIHHDNGLLGSASFDAAEERKVMLLKARGYNAVRPSHNLFSPAFLDACDRHGLLVVEETFDVWREHKVPDDYATYFDDAWRDDLKVIVLSTRHHPSIVMWSIGNEIPERNTARGVETQWSLANEIHKLDPSRPVTAAINGFAGQMVTPSASTARPGRAGVADQTSAIFLDVVGYNYKLADYEADHARFPHRIMFGTESFALDTAAIWELTERSPWLIGDFVWTAMDYLGEAGIGGSSPVAARDANSPMPRLAQWPWVNAFCGDIDLVGQPKPASYLRDVVWGLSALEVAVQRPLPEGKADRPSTWGWHDELSSWTWPGSEGQPLTIRLYTSGDRVELHMNGRLLEAKPVLSADRKRVEFTAAYQAGALEAVAFRDGSEIARRRLNTAGKATAIRVTPERPAGGRARGDISYISVELLDANGSAVFDTGRVVAFTVSGPAELIAFGSANPFAVGSLQSGSTQTWNGRALAIVRGRGSADRVDLTASAEGLAPGTAVIRLV